MEVKIEKIVTLVLGTNEVKQLQDLMEFAKIYMDEKKAELTDYVGESARRQHAVNLGLASLQELQDLQNFMLELFEI